MAVRGIAEPCDIISHPFQIFICRCVKKELGKFVKVLQKKYGSVYEIWNDEELGWIFQRTSQVVKA